MKQIKERGFSDSDSGITTDKIKQCGDINELLNWKITIESNLLSAQMSIDRAVGEQVSSGVYLAPEKWSKLKGYRKVLGFLSQRIQHRIRELRYEGGERGNFFELFYTEALKQLPEQLFMEIKLAAKSRNNEGSN